ncbi:UDP-glucuronic acid/UDP-N-acetylgalactosamine transporter [Platysternon megacephalum]|uniref:UDP-glucuronic acid/UDP-N-acetylgalactosamine transporter n=1 Tax=Platysternon megacephalum TaxID=55544 RepID=A0A4D9DXU8_9SAUR|nr:UDP-glucuronic acid/UDP-N-acetylgalactosamine transporter [Platysternon megacephalum]
MLLSIKPVISVLFHAEIAFQTQQQLNLLPKLPEITMVLWHLNKKHIYMMSHRTSILVMKRNREMDILKGVSLPEQIQCHLTSFHSNKGAGRYCRYSFKMFHLFYI